MNMMVVMVVADFAQLNVLEDLAPKINVKKLMKKLVKKCKEIYPETRDKFL
jgi:hypothetical protein